MHSLDEIVRHYGSFGKTRELREEGYLVHSTTDGFGFIIPKNTGVVYRHQVSGVMCAKEYLEGVFLPLKNVDLYEGKHPHSLDKLFTDLVENNYLSKVADIHPLGNKNAREIWEEIKDKVRFDFEVLDGRDPPNNEGWCWIKITEAHRLDCFNGLIGEELVMVYPNCD